MIKIKDQSKGKISLAEEDSLLTISGENTDHFARPWVGNEFHLLKDLHLTELSWTASN